MGNVGPSTSGSSEPARPVSDRTGTEVTPEALAAVRAGCQETFGKFSNQCRAYLLHVANRELSDDLRAKVGPSDLVQETLLEAQQTIDRFRGQTEAELLAWLRKILLHKAAGAGRHFRATAKRDVGREVPLEVFKAESPHGNDPPDRGLTPSKQMMIGERTEALRQAIERLTPSHRTVILLRAVEQCSFAEVGARMQRSEQAAAKLWLRAVEALREELGTADESR